jgi:hypothetical protein
MRVFLFYKPALAYQGLIIPGTYKATQRLYLGPKLRDLAQITRAEDGRRAINCRKEQNE